MYLEAKPKEEFFSKLKKLLRKADNKNKVELIRSIQERIHRFSVNDLNGYINLCSGGIANRHIFNTTS